MCIFGVNQPKIVCETGCFRKRNSILRDIKSLFGRLNELGLHCLVLTEVHPACFTYSVIKIHSKDALYRSLMSVSGLHGDSSAPLTAAFIVMFGSYVPTEKCTSQ